MVALYRILNFRIGSQSSYCHVEISLLVYFYGKKIRRVDMSTPPSGSADGSKVDRDYNLQLNAMDMYWRKLFFLFSLNFSALLWFGCVWLCRPRICMMLPNNQFVHVSILHHLINTGRRDRVTPTRLQLPTKASPDLSPFVTRSLQEKAKGIKRCP
jgi:hypothetical protein